MRLWIAGFAVLVLLVVRAGRPDPEAGGARSPEAFVERAQEIIDAGGLRADCTGGEPRLVEHLDVLGEEQRRWYRESWLSEDVARYRADPEGFGWAFLVDADCRLRGVHPSVHAVELPYSRPVRWRGRLLYGGRATSGVLRSEHRTLSLRRAVVPTEAGAVGTSPVGAPGDLIQEGSVLLHWGDPAHPAVRLFPVASADGETLVLERRSGADGPRGEVRWNGALLEPGRRIRLETGDWIHLRALGEGGSEETFVVLGAENLETASAVRRRNDRWERSVDDPGLGRVPIPPTARTQPWLAGVADDVDRALRRLPQERAEALAGGFDVELGLRRDLQQRLDQRLEAGVRSIGRRRGGDVDFPAGITVLDGRSGEVLALATWSGDAAAPGNENLRRHPIGSAMKPFLFAAVLDAFPQLGDLVVDGHAEDRRHRGLFGCELPVGYHWLDGHATALDLPTALEVSCNRFAVELTTLSLAAIPRGERLQQLVERASDPAAVRLDAGGRWAVPDDAGSLALGGRRLLDPPDLSRFLLPGGADGACGALDRLDQVGWRAGLGELTGASTARTLPDSRSTALRGTDVTPWEPLLDLLSRGVDVETAWRVRSSFAGSSPERVELALDTLTRLRADWVSFVLGGGTSTWTNVQLAEAMARLVSGRRVEARLAARAFDGRTAAHALGEEAPAPLLSLASAARAPVLEGMRRVVEGARGTARSLRDPLGELRRAFPRDRILLYAKTGSPVVESLVPGDVATALEQLVVRRGLELSGGRLVARSGGERTPWARDGSSTARRRFADAVARALADVGAGGVSAGSVLDAVDLLGRGLERGAGDDLEGPLRVDRGRLRLDRTDPLFRTRTVRGMAGVHVAAVVRVPGDGPMPPTLDELAAPTTSLVVVAAHARVGPGSPVATGLVREALADLEPFLR